jgi:hypothetical protein
MYEWHPLNKKLKRLIAQFEKRKYKKIRVEDINRLKKLLE